MLIGLVERRGRIKKWQKREEAMNLDAWGRDTRGQKVSCPDKEGTPQSVKCPRREGKRGEEGDDSLRWLPTLQEGRFS